MNKATGLFVCLFASMRLENKQNSLQMLEFKGLPGSDFFIVTIINI